MKNYCIAIDCGLLAIPVAEANDLSIVKDDVLGDFCHLAPHRALALNILIQLFGESGNDPIALRHTALRDAMLIAENGVVAIHQDRQLAGLGAIFRLALHIADSEIAKVFVAYGISFS